MNIQRLFIFLSYIAVSQQSFIRNPFIRQSNRKNNTLEYVVMNKREKHVNALSRNDLFTLLQIWITITLFTFPVVAYPWDYKRQ